MTTFADFQLDDDINRAISMRGFDQPTLIQEMAIPLALDGKDLLASAPTGTGKTRVSIALAKRLLDAGWAKRVLFLCDRKELRKQAANACARECRLTPAVADVVANRIVPEVSMAFLVSSGPGNRAHGRPAMANRRVNDQIPLFVVLLTPCNRVVVDHEHLGTADRDWHLQPISAIVKTQIMREHGDPVEDLLLRAVRES